MLWLDHKIFGNGYGLKSPYFDNIFYWLSGRLYTWSGGYGAQLHSMQWRHPNAGETRQLLGQQYRPFHSSRHWTLLFGFLPICRVEVAWCTYLPDDIDAANAELRKMRAKLSAL